MPIPTDEELYKEARDFIRSRYKKNSAFASGAIVKHYKQQFKKRYGEFARPYKDDKSPKNLKRWFDERWVNINPLLGILNDKAYPVFRPTHRVSTKTPTLYQEIPESNLKKQFKLKQKYKGEYNLPTFEKESP
jgi:hypothetical protein